MQPNEGLTLDRYLSEKGPLDPARVIRIALQVAQQLGSGASPFPVHPGRILATKEGVVRLLPPHAEDLALPAIVEFPAYASPEEIRGSQPDIRSTLYSLGCTTFELLTGAPPYGGKDPKDVLRAHVEDPVPDVRDSALADVSEGLAETLRELLEKDPELRIQSPEELVRRLRQSASAPTTPPADGRTRGGTPPAGSKARSGALPGLTPRPGRGGEFPALPAAKAAPAPSQGRPMSSRPTSPGKPSSTRPAPGRPRGPPSAPARAPSPRRGARTRPPGPRGSGPPA